MALSRDKLRDNLSEVRERIARAAAASGRTVDSVRMVAVTKQVSDSVARELVELGVRELGESRPQELWRKSGLLPDSIRWHLIGPLQRNKARRTLPLVDLIHSVDDSKLLQRLDELAQELELEPAVLLEVNVSGEATKRGFRPDEVPDILSALGDHSRVRVCGLMTMAPYGVHPERARPTFVALRELQDRLLHEAASRCTLTELSMGMSGDYEVAIAEGATIVRIGSALFRDDGCNL